MNLLEGLCELIFSQVNLTGFLNRTATAAKIVYREYVLKKWVLSNRAGNFRYFRIFSIIINDFFALIIKLITYFLTSPI